MAKHELLTPMSTLSVQCMAMWPCECSGCFYQTNACPLLPDWPQFVLVFLFQNMAQAVKVISLKNELNLFLLLRMRKDMLFHSKTISGQYSYKAQLTR